MLIYLVGVDHVIQYWGFRNDYDKQRKEPFLQKFKTYLENVCRKRNIKLIAEEFNEDAFANTNTTKSTAKESTDSIKVEHLFADPTRKERKTLNIQSGDKEKREQEWLNRLLHLPYKRVLFICGSCHLRSFEQLLQKNNLEVHILSDKWGYEYLGKGLVEYFDG